MSSDPQFNFAQLQGARAKAWHQSGEPLQTLDGVREWINSFGIVLFAPRAQHIDAPAPSLVEATLGTKLDAASAAHTGTARSFVARLLAEGNALPLNLLGSPGDMPDFVVSAQVFSFIFTLHGNKLWKQPPATAGTVKVTPLALGVYELLSQRGAMSAAELATELGREVTEGAITRALNELWSQLRVLPLLQQGEGVTLWELTTTRFTKAIKSGANAGQPTALSALVSLYLAQALLASEEEIATFLSPLAARSRIREVVHGLSAARQLEPIVLEGKELLHIPGTLPEFPAVEEPAAAEASEETPAPDSAAPAEGRIKRFAPAKERGPRDFKGKPAAGLSRGERKPFGDRAARPPRPFGERSDRERRPFKRDSNKDSAAAQSNFTRPWTEERKPRNDRPASSEGSETAAEQPYKRTSRPPAGDSARQGGFTKRPYSAGAGSRDRSAGRGPARKSFGDKPAFRRDRGEGFTPRARSAEEGAERRPYKPRERTEQGTDSRPPRRNFDRPSGSGFGAKRPFVRRDSEAGAKPSYGGSNSKPREEAPKRDFRRNESSAGRPPRSYDRNPSGPRPSRAGAKPPYKRRDDAGSERPSRPAFGEKRPFRPRAEGSEGRSPRPSFGAKPPYARREGAEGSRGDRPPRPFRGGSTEGERPRSFGSRDSRPSGPKRGPAGGSFGRGESTRSGGKVPFGGKPSFGRRPGGSGRPAAPKKRRPEE